MLDFLGKLTHRASEEGPAAFAAGRKNPRADLADLQTGVFWTKYAETIAGYSAFRTGRANAVQGIFRSAPGGPVPDLFAKTNGSRIRSSRGYANDADGGIKIVRAHPRHSRNPRLKILSLRSGEKSGHH